MEAYLTREEFLFYYKKFYKKMIERFKGKGFTFQSYKHDSGILKYDIGFAISKQGARSIVKFGVCVSNYDFGGGQQRTPRYKTDFKSPQEYFDQVEIKMIEVQAKIDEINSWIEAR